MAVLHDVYPSRTGIRASSVIIYKNTIMRHLFIICLLSLLVLTAYGQGSQLPQGNQAYHIVDRLAIKGVPAEGLHTSIKYYDRATIARFALLADSLAGDRLTSLDRSDLGLLFRDNNEWLGVLQTPFPGMGPHKQPEGSPSLIELSQQHAFYARSQRPLLKGKIYPTPANFYQIDEPHFHFRLNPLLQLRYGPMRHEGGEGRPYFINQRGLEARAGIDDRVYVYFQLLESQAAFPDYVNQWIVKNRALPGNGLYKGYNSDVFDIQGGYDYLNSQGYVAFQLSRHLSAQWGYGRHFIGDGMRSMLLSDFTNNYLYLKLNWNVGRFHYQNLFTELNALSANSTPGDLVVPKKYMAAHYLSVDLTPRLRLGLFEAVVYQRGDGLELGYLNPVILYRTVEHALGSADNALIGLDGRWNVANRVQLYGQLMIDEFIFKELVTERRGWWGNKFGIQAGVKYIDVLGIDHLDLQAELNLARPYTYTHRDSTTAYTHYNQPLAHPLGANFYETILSLRYQPKARWLLSAQWFQFAQGQDPAGRNFGSNLLLPHTSRTADYGISMLQGLRADTWMGVVDLGYMLRHNLWVEAQYMLRRQRVEGGVEKNMQLFNLGLRLNIDRPRLFF